MSEAPPLAFADTSNLSLMLPRLVCYIKEARKFFFVCPGPPLPTILWTGTRRSIPSIYGKNTPLYPSSIDVPYQKWSKSRPLIHHTRTSTTIDVVDTFKAESPQGSNSPSHHTLVATMVAKTAALERPPPTLFIVAEFTPWTGQCIRGMGLWWREHRIWMLLGGWGGGRAGGRARLDSLV